MVADTATRVARQTPDRSNERIRRQTQRNIAFFSQHPESIDDRLAELDREWDIEHAVETQLSAAGLAGLLLSLTVSKRFLLLTALTTAFMLQHAIQGWCPPVSLWRRLGIRSAREIDEERRALIALRDGQRRMHAGEEPRPSGPSEGATARKPKQNRQSRAGDGTDGRAGRRTHESS